MSDAIILKQWAIARAVNGPADLVLQLTAIGDVEYNIPLTKTQAAKLAEELKAHSAT